MTSYQTIMTALITIVGGVGIFFSIKNIIRMQRINRLSKRIRALALPVVKHYYRHVHAVGPKEQFDEQLGARIVEYAESRYNLHYLQHALLANVSLEALNGLADKPTIEEFEVMSSLTRRQEEEDLGYIMVLISLDLSNQLIIDTWQKNGFPNFGGRIKELTPR